MLYKKSWTWFFSPQSLNFWTRQSNQVQYEAKYTFEKEKPLIFELNAIFYY